MPVPTFPETAPGASASKASGAETGRTASHAPEPERACCIRGQRIRRGAAGTHRARNSGQHRHGARHLRGRDRSDRCRHLAREIPFPTRVPRERPRFMPRIHAAAPDPEATDSPDAAPAPAPSAAAIWDRIAVVRQLLDHAGAARVRPLIDMMLERVGAGQFVVVGSAPGSWRACCAGAAATRSGCRPAMDPGRARWCPGCCSVRRMVRSSTG